MLARGGCHTAETARGATYVYPSLVLPVAAALESAWPGRRDRALLTAAVFGQALVMQVVGYYWW